MFVLGWHNPSEIRTKHFITILIIQYCFTGVNNELQYCKKKYIYMYCKYRIFSGEVGAAFLPDFQWQRYIYSQFK